MDQQTLEKYSLHIMGTLATLSSLALIYSQILIVQSAKCSVWFPMYLSMLFQVSLILSSYFVYHNYFHSVNLIIVPPKGRMKHHMDWKWTTYSFHMYLFLAPPALALNVVHSVSCHNSIPLWSIILSYSLSVVCIGISCAVTLSAIWMFCVQWRRGYGVFHYLAYRRETKKLINAFKANMDKFKTNMELQTAYIGCRHRRYSWMPYLAPMDLEFIERMYTFKINSEEEEKRGKIRRLTCSICDQNFLEGERVLPSVCLGQDQCPPLSHFRCFESHAKGSSKCKHCEVALRDRLFSRYYTVENWINNMHDIFLNDPRPVSTSNHLLPVRPILRNPLMYIPHFPVALPMGPIEVD